MILTGLRLCFLPRAGPVRRLKEAAAAAAGAELAEQPEPGVTHVLVEHISQLPPCGPFHVLYSSWIADSLEVGSLLPECIYEVREVPPLLSIKRPLSPAVPIPPPKRGVAQRSLRALRTTATAGTPSKAATKTAASQKESPVADNAADTAEPQPTNKARDLEIKLGSAAELPISARPNVNQQLVDVLAETAALLELEADEFRAAAYWDASRALSRLETAVTSGAHARQLSSAIGVGASAVIDSCLQQRLPATVRRQMRQKTQSLRSFRQLYGVGASEARRLYDAGCRTIEDVRSHTTKPTVLVSIDHYQSLAERISRTEVEQHFELVKQALARVDGNAIALCLGSYVRNQADCGDIDVLLLKPGLSRRDASQLVHSVAEEMRRTGQAAYTFAESSSTWFGASVLPGWSRWRRLDLFSSPWKERGAKQLHCTGPGHFNRALRLRAKKMGMHLSDQGIYAGVDAAMLLESESERRIFETLGLKYLEPSERSLDNISDLPNAGPSTKAG